MQPPTGAGPLDPACFWIEDYSEQVRAQRHFSKKTLPDFSNIIFLEKNCFFLKSSETYANLVLDRMKKKIWVHLLECIEMVKSTISKKKPLHNSPSSLKSGQTLKTS